MATVQIGHNRPPPFDTWSIHISDLFEEGKNFLDGSPIGSDDEAAEVSKLLDAFRKAGKDADAARAAEKKPHDDAAKAVQAKWKPLIDRAGMGADGCKAALTPWLRKKDEEARAAAEVARQEAARIAAEAEKARLAAQSGGLEAREAAEAAAKEAERAQAVAAKADKQKAAAKGGDRAVTLRSRWECEIADRRALLNHYAVRRPDDLTAWLLDMAKADVRSGIRSLPGVNITEVKEAV